MLKIWKFVWGYKFKLVVAFVAGKRTNSIRGKQHQGGLLIWNVQLSYVVDTYLQIFLPVSVFWLKLPILSQIGYSFQTDSQFKVHTLRRSTVLLCVAEIKLRNTELTPSNIFVTNLSYPFSLMVFKTGAFELIRISHNYDNRLLGLHFLQLVDKNCVRVFEA